MKLPCVFDGSCCSAAAQLPPAIPNPPHPTPPHSRSHVQDDLEMEVDSWLRRKFEGALKEVEVVHREDLDLVGCGFISVQVLWG